MHIHIPIIHKYATPISLQASCLNMPYGWWRGWKLGNSGRVTFSEKDQSLIVPRKVNFMVSLKSYRIQPSSASCNYKSKMNFQKTGLFFSKCIVLGARHVWWVWLLWFCTYWNWKHCYISSLRTI